ncbi:OsmC family protein [Rhizobium sp. LjRoot258]
MSPGPNPYDLLSASLAACTAMTVRFQAGLRKFPLERVEVGVSFYHGAQGERDSFERTLVSAHSCWRPQTFAPLAKFSALVQIFTHARTPLLPAATQALRLAMRMIWLNYRSRTGGIAAVCEATGIARSAMGCASCAAKRRIQRFAASVARAPAASRRRRPTRRFCPTWKILLIRRRLRSDVAVEVNLVKPA